MWNNTEYVNDTETNSSPLKEKKKLSHEILGLFAATMLISVFVYLFLSVAANSLILNYAESHEIIYTEYEQMDLDFWIQGISFFVAAVLFVFLFLFLVGERLAYIREIVKGIEALGRHEWDYRIPVNGDNELAELAGLMNQLSQEEKAFQEAQKKMQEEKESLIRALSHDIRTPLTSILSYSEFMRNKECLSEQEIISYMELMEQKASQIKVLTDRLLDGGSRQLEWIENGRFFMQQLAEEWCEELEDGFTCRMDFDACPEFEGEYDIQEFRRIFDNLASNIRKYANPSEDIILRVFAKNNHICIEQTNACRILTEPVDSRNIGLDSIRRIVAQYGGCMQMEQKDVIFRISLELPCKFL